TSVISSSCLAVKEYCLFLRKVRKILVRLRLLVSCFSFADQSTKVCNCVEKYSGVVLENVSYKHNSLIFCFASALFVNCIKTAGSIPLFKIISFAVWRCARLKSSLFNKKCCTASIIGLVTL